MKLNPGNAINLIKYVYYTVIRRSESNEKNFQDPSLRSE